VLTIPPPGPAGQRKVVIVGAGPGGLASAMLLGAAGFDVTVLEARDSVGGRTSALEANGYRFDLGPTFFLYPQILREIFAMCGRRLDDEIELIRLDPHYRLLFGAGGELRATSDLARMQAEIARLCPADAKRLPDYLADNRRKLAAAQPVLQSPIEGLRDLLRLDLPRIAAHLRPLTSVDTDLKRFFSDPRVRLAFTFQSKYLGMSPFKCPSLFSILSFLEYEHGVFHPRGGCAAVSDAMARVARSLGVDIRLGEPVERFDFNGRRPVAARTRHARYPCEALVINADFAETMTRLVPDELRRRWRNARIERKRFSCSTYMLYLGLDGSCPGVEHHNVYLDADYQAELEDIETHHRLSDAPSFYVQNAVVSDPSLAPPGHTALYVLVPVTHLARTVDWSSARTGFRARVLERLALIGVEDVARRIRFEREVTPLDWARDLRIYRGATFNLAHNLGQMLHRRPHNRFEDLDGVYLTGGGTHPGSGLPVIFESARISTRLLAEDLGVRPSWASPGNVLVPGAGLQTAVASR